MIICMKLWSKYVGGKSITLILRGKKILGEGLCFGEGGRLKGCKTLCLSQCLICTVCVEQFLCVDVDDLKMKIKIILWLLSFKMYFSKQSNYWPKFQENARKVDMWYWVLESFTIFQCFRKCNTKWPLVCLFVRWFIPSESFG